jgi:hypothetical protein
VASHSSSSSSCGAAAGACNVHMSHAVHMCTRVTVTVTGWLYYSTITSTSTVPVVVCSLLVPTSTVVPASTTGSTAPVGGGSTVAVIGS